MKLKYKKIILLTTMSTMGIGLLTLSVSHDRTDAKESLNLQPTVVASADKDTAVEETFAAGTQSNPTVLSSDPTDAPTPSPSPVTTKNLASPGAGVLILVNFISEYTYTI